MTYTQIINVCEDIIAEKLSIFEGIRKLIICAYDAHIENDELFISLRAIDSQTDHLPLINKQLSDTFIKQIQEEEEFYKKEVFALVNNILKKYKTKIEVS